MLDLSKFRAYRSAYAFLAAKLLRRSVIISTPLRFLNTTRPRGSLWSQLQPICSSVVLIIVCFIYSQHSAVLMTCQRFYQSFFPFRSPNKRSNRRSSLPFCFVSPRRIRQYRLPQAAMPLKHSPMRSFPMPLRTPYKSF